MGERGIHRRFYTRFAVAALAAVVAVNSPGPAIEASANFNQNGKADCLPDLASPAKGRGVVNIDEGFLLRHGLTVDKAVNQAVRCKGDEGVDIFIAAGRFPLRNAVRLGSDVTLKGEGPSTVLAYDVSSESDDDEMIGVPSYGKFRNIVIEDLEVQGPGASAIEKEMDGIQLRAAEDSSIRNVTAKRWSRDGIHFSFNGENGVNSSTISDCEVSENGRNGISITHGSGNIVQRCLVSLNNLVRRGIYGVAGISLEPDSNNKVFGNRIRWNNIIFNRFHGIGLAIENQRRGNNSGNIICENNLEGNQADQISDLTQNKENPNKFIRNSHPQRGKNGKMGSQSDQVTGEC